MNVARCEVAISGLVSEAWHGLVVAEAGRLHQSLERIVNQGVCWSLEFHVRERVVCREHRLAVHQLANWHVEYASQGASHREVHLRQQFTVAKVATQAIHMRVDLQTAQASVTLFVGTVQPLKGLVRFAPVSVYLSDLVSHVCLMVRDG